MVQDCNWHFIKWEYNKLLECVDMFFLDLTTKKQFIFMVFMDSNTSKGLLTYERTSEEYKREYIPKYFFIKFLKNMYKNFVHKESNLEYKEFKNRLLNTAIRNVKSINMTRRQYENIKP